MNSHIVFFLALCAGVYGQNRGQQPGRVVAIVRQASDVNPDGSYAWSFETDNGISAQEQGGLKSVSGSKDEGNSAQGGWAYTAPDNTPVQFKYIADENGFQPESNLIPTPPPIPALILRALEWIKAHPEKEEPVSSNRRF